MIYERATDHQKPVYKMEIRRYVDYRTFSRYNQQRTRDGWTVQDTWDNEFGNIYAILTKCEPDEQLTFKAYGRRYGKKYKNTSEKFKEYFLREREDDFFHHVFANITKREVIDYYDYVIEAMREFLPLETLLEFYDYLKEKPIADDERWHKEQYEDK